MDNHLVKLTVLAVFVFAFACGGKDEGAVRPGDSSVEGDDAAQETKKDGGGVVYENVDECADPELNDCDDNADCTDIEKGSYECQCKPGFEGDGKSCKDIDECEGDTNTCNAEAKCTNTIGSFTCECNEGFEGDGIECEDVIECDDPDLYECEENEQCINTRGSYRCECVLPYSEDEDGKCRPLCEIVMEDSDVCDPNAICRINTDGEAECVQCRYPYFGDGKECEQDDACENLDCGENAVCVEGDTSDSRECECALGFEGDPTDLCSDIDECDDNSDNDCEADKSECLNLDGGYYCDCEEGYKNKDGSCVNIDECAYTGDDYPCSDNAECDDRTPEQDPPFYECTCKDGFRGSGTSCSEINECTDKEDPDDCGDHSECRNIVPTDGGPGYRCQCNSGYTGGGIGKDCYCDLSGYWAMKQVQTVSWDDVKWGPVTLFYGDEIEITNWELFRLEYDGEKIEVQRKGCAQSDTPHLRAAVAQLKGEIYSSYLPDDVMLAYSFGDAMPITLANAEPGADVESPEEEAFITGIVMDDPYHDAWPDRGDIKTWDGTGEAPVPPYWEDTDEDGEPGVTIWQRGPGDQDDTPWCYCEGATELCPDDAYPPAWIDEGEADRRTVCTSTAGRSTGQIVGTLDNCSKITGEILTDSDMTNARVYSCIVIPDSLKGQTHTCNAADWVAAKENVTNGLCDSAPCMCDEDQIEFLDGTDPSDESTTTFEMVKIETLDREPSCGEVVGAFEALPPVELDCSE